MKQQWQQKKTGSDLETTVFTGYLSYYCSECHRNDY